MRAIVFYLILPLIYLVSLSPSRLLYAISDGLYFIVYYIIGYRKKIVNKNLSNSFPDKSPKEIKALEKQYYSYLFDLILETIKTITMSEKYVRKHVKFNNPEMLDAIYDQGRSIVIVMGHFGNWELAGPSFSLNCKHQLNVIYKPLSNKYFEGLFSKTRTKFTTRIIPMKNTLRAMAKNKNELVATAFVADQTPSNTKTGVWLKFLNQDTTVFTGPEKMSKMFDAVVVYMQVLRTRRGFYEVNPTILFEHPKTSNEEEITTTFFNKLEEDINTNPVTWLWSHRRWKHKK